MRLGHTSLHAEFQTSQGYYTAKPCVNKEGKGGEGRERSTHLPASWADTVMRNTLGQSAMIWMEIPAFYSFLSNHLLCAWSLTLITGRVCQCRRPWAGDSPQAARRCDYSPPEMLTAMPSFGTLHTLNNACLASFTQHYFIRTVLLCSVLQLHWMKNLSILWPTFRVFSPKLLAITNNSS